MLFTGLHSLLKLVGLADALGVIIVARRLEELLEAAVVRVNCKRAAMLRGAMLRERMMQHPATLLRFFSGCLHTSLKV